MNNRSGIGALKDTDMGIAVLFIGHRLAVLAEWTTGTPTCFHKLIGVPFSVFSNPCRNVVSPLPENQLCWRLIEADHYVRIRSNPPFGVPQLVKFKVGIICAEATRPF